MGGPRGVGRGKMRVSSIENLKERTSSWFSISKCDVDGIKRAERDVVVVDVKAIRVSIAYLGFLASKSPDEVWGGLCDV